MLILMRLLGPGYIVWDKAASIQFKRPGRGRVKARFHISNGEVETIRAGADQSEKMEPTFFADVLDEHGEVVAHVEKLVYVRKKPRKSLRIISP